jgi:Negative regulator of sigma F
MDFDFDKLSEIPDPLDPAPQPSSALPPPLDVRSVAAPKRSRIRSLQLAAFAVVMTLELALAMKLGFHFVQEMTPAYGMLAFVLPVIGSAVAMLLTVLPGRLGLGLPPSRIAAGLGFAVLTFAISTMASSEHASHTFTVASTRGCAIASIVYGALAFGAGVLLFKRAFATNAWLRMTAFGVSTGLLGAVMIRTHCSTESLLHLVVGHGAALLVFSLLGATVGHRVARV